MSTRRTWVTALVILAVFIVPLLVLLSLHGPPVDLAVYQLAGKMFASGGGLYESPWGTSLAMPLPYTYPPLWAAVMAPAGWVPWRLATLAWALLNVATLWWIVGVSYRRFLETKEHARPIAIAALVVAVAVTAPLASVFWFGQLGILLTAACLADTVPAKTRLPRGMLVGIATAVKLTPGIFVVYWLITKRWRAALTAAATTLGLSIVVAFVRPDLSHRFWTDVVFRTDRVGDAAFVSNQSIYGWLLRSGWSSPVIWAALAGVALVVGLRRAAKAHSVSDELAAATLIGITGLLVSPVSWIHHGVWIVPASGILLADGRDRWRRALWLGMVCLFVLRLPDWTASGALSVGPVLTPIFENAYLWAYVVMLVFLPVGTGRERVDYPSVESAIPS
jgi:alpha-1,2-mannosyltransferase